VRWASAVREDARSLGLEVRAGLHAGEVQQRGEDVSGIALHIGQRVSAEASPGEVLVSSTVKDLLAGSDLAFRDRGEHDLKGIPGLWRLYAVA
jgi:class 3 adenylate cyclase